MPPTDGRGASTRERATSGPDAQDGLFDKQWEDTDLEAALEARETAKDARTEAQSAYKIKDDNVKALLANYHLAVGEVARVGRFKIKKIEVRGNSVAFDTAPREQLNIGTIT